MAILRTLLGAQHRDAITVDAAHEAFDPRFEPLRHGDEVVPDVTLLVVVQPRLGRTTTEVWVFSRLLGVADCVEGPVVLIGRRRREPGRHHHVRVPPTRVGAAWSTDRPGVWSP